MQNLPLQGRLHFFGKLSNIIGLTFTSLGVITLFWVGLLVWHDLTVWSKDLVLIFFSSRTAEHMFPTLGLDMRVIHYFLIGLTLLFSGMLVILRRTKKEMKQDLGHSANQLKTRRNLSSCSHHFGYLRYISDLCSVPEECLTCKRVIECRNPQA